MAQQSFKRITDLDTSDVFKGMDVLAGDLDVGGGGGDKSPSWWYGIPDSHAVGDDFVTITTYR